MVTKPSPSVSSLRKTHQRTCPTDILVLLLLRLRIISMTYIRIIPSWSNARNSKLGISGGQCMQLVGRLGLFAKLLYPLQESYFSLILFSSYGTASVYHG